MKVTFDGSICQHAGECVKGSPDVFSVVDNNLIIETEKGNDDQNRATIAKCPSGALKIAED